jgi:hypothetical protein
VGAFCIDGMILRLIRNIFVLDLELDEIRTVPEWEKMTKKWASLFGRF